MRIRSIKPEFWSSADIAGLDYFHRLLFIGLWSYVDDTGVGEEDISLIRSSIFPRDTNVDELHMLITVGLQEYSRRGTPPLITRFRDTRNGRIYFKITNWQHQVINKPSRSKKPLPTSDDIELLEPYGSPPVVVTESYSLEQGNKGTREQGSRGTRDSCATPSRDIVPTKTTAAFDEFWGIYPRRRDKANAVKAFTNALRRADARTIIDGARRYANDPNRQDEFTKYAQGWLNADGWLDEPLPVRTENRATSDLRVEQAQALKNLYPTDTQLEIE